MTVRLCSIKNIRSAFFGFITKHARDRRTKRQTDRITTPETALASTAASRGKNHDIYNYDCLHDSAITVRALEPNLESCELFVQAFSIDRAAGLSFHRRCFRLHFWLDVTSINMSDAVESQHTSPNVIVRPETHVDMTAVWRHRSKRPKERDISQEQNTLSVCSTVPELLPRDREQLC